MSEHETTKAKDYALRRAELYQAGGVKGFDSWRGLETELEAAYRAGYQAGQTDAHRKEFVVEQPTHFERGMT